MSPTLALILALLATHTGKVGVENEEDAVKQMQEREEYLHEEMTRLRQEIFQIYLMKESLATLQQQWLFQVIDVVLLLVGFWLLKRWRCGSGSCRKQQRFAFCRWLVGRWKHGSGSCKEQEGSMQKVGSTEKVNSEEKQFLPIVEALKQLVDDLPGVCRVLSRRNFMPELHTAPGTDTTIEDWSTQENGSTYRLLVILRPPPGLSFILDTTEQPQAGRIRVGLECQCPAEQLLGKICFLHPSAGQLPMEQCSYLLNTLCTDCFLDVEKVICWVQMLVVSAWQLLPQSLHCQLTALPLEKCCSFQLSSPSGMQSTIEMALAVQPGSSGAYLSLE